MEAEVLFHDVEPAHRPINRSRISRMILRFRFDDVKHFVTCLLVVYATTALARGQAVAPEGNAWRAELVSNAGAPVKVTEFFDYECPFCAAVIPALEEALRGYPGKVQLILKNTPLSIHTESMLAHQAAMAAAEQGKFWEMHSLLFANQSRLGRDSLIEYAQQLHLDVARFRQRLESEYYKTTIEQDMALAEKLGVNGTPTFLVNGEQLIGVQSATRLKQAIEHALNPMASPLPSKRGERPLTPSNLDLSRSPVRGTKAAPVTIVEFSDFQCPFCSRVAPTLLELLKQHPDHIKWVFKNFPLDFHPDSALAHRAALAAAEQGKFWEMHDLIFADQTAMKREDLLAKARTLSLDMVRFAADLDSEKLKRLVESDVDEGTRLNVSGTPTFFVNGREYSGAMSLSQFNAITGSEMAPGDPDPAGPNEGRNGISTGPPDATITLTWFEDLSSTLSLRATLQVRQLLAAHPGKIRVVFKNRPLETHPDAMKVHSAALAANSQGKFWQMLDLIVANPQKDDRTTLLGYASRLGLDVKQFESEMDSALHEPDIRRDLSEAFRRGVSGSPTFFINSTRIDGLQPQELLESVIADELAKARRASAPPLPQSLSETGNLKH